MQQVATREGVSVPIYNLLAQRCAGHRRALLGRCGGYGKIGADGWPGSGKFPIRTGKLWAGYPYGENVLFARQRPLQALLMEHGYTLLWWWLGERRGFMDFGKHRQENGDLAWADYHGIGYLGTDGRIQTARIDKKMLKRQQPN